LVIVKIVRTSVLATVLVVFAAAAQASDPFYTALLTRGVSDAQRGDHFRAVKEFRIAAFGLVDDPGQYLRAQVYLANSLEKLGQHADAAAAVDKASRAERINATYASVAIDPDTRSAFEVLAAKSLRPEQLAMVPSFKHTAAAPPPPVVAAPPPKPAPAPPPVVVVVEKPVMQTPPPPPTPKPEPVAQKPAPVVTTTQKPAPAVVVQKPAIVQKPIVVETKPAPPAPKPARRGRKASAVAGDGRIRSGVPDRRSAASAERRKDPRRATDLRPARAERGPQSRNAARCRQGPESDLGMARVIHRVSKGDALPLR
jgi:hypothetical protein